MGVRYSGAASGRLHRKLACALFLASCLGLIAADCEPDFNNVMPTQDIPQCHESPPVPCRTDGGDITVYVGDLGSNMAWTTIFALEDSYKPTDAGGVVYVSTPKTTGPGETDIIYRYGALSGSTVGQYICDDDSIGSNRCDSSYITYDGGDLAPIPYQFSNYAEIFKSLACHETGHAIGLTHGNDADPNVSANRAELMCMRKPLDPGSPIVSVGPWETHLINKTY